jgi:hypothetical protein
MKLKMTLLPVCPATLTLLVVFVNRLKNDSPIQSSFAKEQRLQAVLNSV